MIPILYENNETAFASNGLGRLRDCITCEVTEERNGLYECDFSYPVGGANFDLIQCGRIIAVRHDDSDDVQPFDIVSYTKPINGVVSFHAVHISYRQRGLVVYGKNINTLADAFTLLKNSATPTNPFTYEADFTATAFMAAADGTPRSVRQMLGGVEGSILDTYGGEYEFDRFRVILHKSRGVMRDFTIRYGVNMLDYKEQTDFQETYNAALPYWTGSDGVKNIIVVGNKATATSPTYSGRQICAALDLSDKFESKPTKTQLKNAALSFINSKQTTLPQQTINVDFVRLQDLGEYENLKSLLQCKLCDSIEVIFPRYNMRGNFKIVKTVYDVLKGKYKNLELGALSTTLAEALGISQSGDKKNAPDVIYINDDGDVEVNANMIINGSLAVNGNTVIYVTDSGTANGWRYRKYSDRSFDAWGTFNVTPSSSTASGNIYYSDSKTVNLPFTAVNDSVFITATVGSQYAWIVNTSTAQTAVSFRIARGTTISTTTALSVRIHAHGEY